MHGQGPVNGSRVGLGEGGGTTRASDSFGRASRQAAGHRSRAALEHTPQPITARAHRRLRPSPGPLPPCMHGHAHHLGTLKRSLSAVSCRTRCLSADTRAVVSGVRYIWLRPLQGRAVPAGHGAQRRGGAGGRGEAGKGRRQSVSPDLCMCALACKGRPYAPVPAHTPRTHTACRPARQHGPIPLHHSTHMSPPPSLQEPNPTAYPPSPCPSTRNTLSLPRPPSCSPRPTSHSGVQRRLLPPPLLHPLPLPARPRSTHIVGLSAFPASFARTRPLAHFPTPFPPPPRATHMVGLSVFSLTLSSSSALTRFVRARPSSSSRRRRSVTDRRCGAGRDDGGGRQESEGEQGAGAFAESKGGRREREAEGGVRGSGVGRVVCREGACERCHTVGRREERGRGIPRRGSHVAIQTSPSPTCPAPSPLPLQPTNPTPPCPIPPWP